MRHSVLFVALFLVACGGPRGTDSDLGVVDGGTVDTGTDAGAVDAAHPDMAGGTDAGSGTDAGAIPAGTIRGTVTRSAGLTFSGDGMGTLWVDVGPSCPYPSPGPGFAVTQTVMVPSVDLTSPSAAVPFSVTGLAAGTYAVWGWLDDNNDGATNPFPSGGDPGNFPTCPTVTIGAAGARADLLFESSTWN